MLDMEYANGRIAMALFLLVSWSEFEAVCRD
jgi:hypothetical protein